jgi:hypothetical protein
MKIATVGLGLAKDPISGSWTGFAGTCHRPQASSRLTCPHRAQCRLVLPHYCTSPIDIATSQRPPNVAGVACQSWIAKRGSHSDSGMKLCRELPCDPVYRELVGANAAWHRQPATSEHMMTQRGFRSTPRRWSRPAPKASDGADVMVENSCSSEAEARRHASRQGLPPGTRFARRSYELTQSINRRWSGMY